ncbi:MAG: barstar family protein [Jatrophihabitans sp.]|uniref:barstar family protein n=1 Tax=Jatrophihabitans sp. TaxID=1932789 RepID=UPI003F8198AD
MSSDRLERVPSADFSARELRLRRDGVDVVELFTGDGSTRKAFFDAVRAAVLLDPPVQSERSWDALADSLWEGLYNLSATKLLIVWRDAATFYHLAPDEYEVAVEVLAWAAASLADPAHTAGEPKDVRVLISS